MENKYRINLEKFCAKKNITLKQLASEVDIQYGLLVEWTKSLYRLNVDDAKKLAEFFGVSLDKLIFETENPPINIDCLKSSRTAIDEFSKMLHMEQMNKKNKSKKKRMRSKKCEELSGIHYRLRFARTEIKGASLKDVARVANVSWQLVQKWETVTAPTGIKDYCVISDYTKVTLDYLLYEDHPLEITSYGMNVDWYYTLINIAERLKEHFIENNEDV